MVDLDLDLDLDSSMTGMGIDPHKWLALRFVWAGVRPHRYRCRFLLMVFRHMAMGQHRVSVLLPVTVVVILYMEVVLPRQGLIRIEAIPATGREWYRNHYTTTKTKIITIIIIKTSTIIAIAIFGTEIGIIVVVVVVGGITIGMEEIGEIGMGVGRAEITCPIDLLVLIFHRARSIRWVAVSREEIREMVVVIVIWIRTMAIR